MDIRNADPCGHKDTCVGDMTVQDGSANAAAILVCSLPLRGFNLLHASEAWYELHANGLHVRLLGSGSDNCLSTQWEIHLLSLLCPQWSPASCTPLFMTMLLVSLQFFFSTLDVVTFAVSYLVGSNCDSQSPAIRIANFDSQDQTLL